MTDKGSVFPAVAGVIAILATMTLAIAELSVVYGARETAANGADAAALAAAVATYPPAGSGDTPMEAARLAAGGNGVAVLGCDCRVDSSMAPRVATVITSLDVELPLFGRVTVRARARAEFDPVRWLGG